MENEIDVERALRGVREYLERINRLRTQTISVHIPPTLIDEEHSLDEVIRTCLPASHALLENAKRGLFFSLPIAFDPGESVGCHLATVDRDSQGQPYRFIDMGAQIATRAFGENDPRMVDAVLRDLPFAVNRYAHSEYQTELSLRLKAALDKIAPQGTRHFVVNTGAEAVENAIKSVLLVRAMTQTEKEHAFVISFEGAFHGRTLGALAVTHRKKAKLGFPTFDWPQVSFPVWDPSDQKASLRREEKSLRQLWELLTAGRASASPSTTKPKEIFQAELERIDQFLLTRGDVPTFVAQERAALSTEMVKKARRAAGVLIEPIQGEGGVRMARPEFYRRLRMMTLIYDVPLIFDEVQSGFGATGKLWAHEHFELPAPPDVVTWAKKAQNGVLFVSEDLATFFQEEKKFNTTWEGDSTGMARFISMLSALDLSEVVRTGERARAGLEKLAAAHPQLIGGVRGLGVMLAFDVARPDWRDVLRDRAFRRGLILLPAGERALRFYPRYDTPPEVLEEALAILEMAVADIAGSTPQTPRGPRLRVGSLDLPLASLDTVELDHKNWAEWSAQIMALEIDCYGSASHYPSDVLRAGKRPLIQYSSDALEATINHARSAGVLLHDRFAGRSVAYAMGAPLENFDEAGVLDDPHHGEHNTFYMQALAVLPSVRNRAEVTNLALERLRLKISALGYSYLSALVEAQLLETGPAWLRSAAVLKTIDNYLQSGLRFAYLQCDL